jgi:hypothetical protein
MLKSVLGRLWLWFTFLPTLGEVHAKSPIIAPMTISPQPPGVANSVQMAKIPAIPGGPSSNMLVRCIKIC